MIQMIAGAFGLEMEDGSVVRKDNTSEPFEASKEAEARLVKLGIAKYVEDAAGNDEDSNVEVVNLDIMNAKDLRAYGKEFGLSFGVGVTKAEMISAIREALAGNDEDANDEDVIEDDEDAPEFDASEAVL